MDKNGLFTYLDTHAAFFTELSDWLWAHPELSLCEYQSAARYCDALEQLGFHVERGIAGIETAFCGSYGSGRPVIGILGEYDALSGLSQQACAVTQEPVEAGGAGHGCGHNLLGAGALAAAAAIRAYLEEKGEGSGTVIFYGCPGEEGGAGKAFMAREGMFRTLDAALTWHPSDVNEVVTGSCLASYQVEYRFHGVAAHAAGCPHLGRSALDALELMNMGAQFLREHIPPHNGLHYAITDAGGRSPNVVQPTAQVLYMLRSDSVPNILKLAERVDDLARGAAIMTGTRFTRRFIDGTADVLPNRVLEELAYENFAAAQLPQYTPDEISYAQAITDTCTPDGVVGFASGFDAEIADFARTASDDGKKPINDFLMPLWHSGMISAGSTDVGDVSRQTPTLQIHTATWPSWTPGHSWQAVSAGKSSIAHKGMLLAARVLAATAWELYEQPTLLTAARAAFTKANRDGYVCPIPADAKPVVAG